MPVRNTPSGYGMATKSLHWITFVLMSMQFAVGYLMTRIDDDYYESIPGMSEDRLFGLHMSLGATVLALGLVRLAWRVLSPLPAWAPTLKPFERRYAHRVEQVLYVLMLAIPLSGMLAAMADGEDRKFFGVLEVPSFLAEDSALEDIALGAHIGTHLPFL